MKQNIRLLEKIRRFSELKEEMRLYISAFVVFILLAFYDFFAKTNYVNLIMAVVMFGTVLVLVHEILYEISKRI